MNVPTDIISKVF